MLVNKQASCARHKDSFNPSESIGALFGNYISNDGQKAYDSKPLCSLKGNE